MSYTSTRPGATSPCGLATPCSMWPPSPSCTNPTTESAGHAELSLGPCSCTWAAVHFVALSGSPIKPGGSSVSTSLGIPPAVPKEPCIFDGVVEHEARVGAKRMTASLSKRIAQRFCHARGETLDAKRHGRRNRRQLIRCRRRRRTAAADSGRVRHTPTRWGAKRCFAVHPDMKHDRWIGRPGCQQRGYRTGNADAPIDYSSLLQCFPPNRHLIPQDRLRSRPEPTPRGARPRWSRGQWFRWMIWGPGSRG